MIAWSWLVVAALPEVGVAPVDDAALVARAQAGEREAFAALYRRHVDRVYGQLSRLVGPVAERDDLVQEAFLRLHRALPRFRGDAALATLLYRITASVAIDHLRTRRRRPTAPLDLAALARLVSPELSGEQRLREARAVAEVYAALDRIKPAKRVALLLHVVEGLGFAEVGAIVGASEETAKKRAQAAQREVRAALGQRGERAP